MPAPADGWNLDLVRAPEAWQRLVPSGEPRDIVWNGVEVAHLDTGWTNHGVFGDLASTWIRVDDGINYIEPGKRPEDPISASAFSGGHGTRTLSVLCGDAREDRRLGANRSRMGVAPGLPAIPYRVSDSVVLATMERRRSVAMAVRDAVLRQGAEVISTSLGFPQLSIFQRHMGSAVDLAYEAGVIVVGAAGQPLDRVSFPGRFWRSIGVGGVRSDGQIYQRYDASDHQYLDVWGPADEIFLAQTQRASGRKVFRVGRSSEDEDSHSAAGSLAGSFAAASAAISAKGNGTSYATVHVSAAAALWWQHRGAEIEHAYGRNRWQIVEAFRALLKQTARPITARQSAPTNGTGILDIAALLDADLPAPSSLKREDRIAAGQIF